jgi:hypothetical protein
VLPGCSRRRPGCWGCRRLRPRPACRPLLRRKPRSRPPRQRLLTSPPQSPPFPVRKPPEFNTSMSRSPTTDQDRRPTSSSPGERRRGRPSTAWPALDRRAGPCRQASVARPPRARTTYLHDCVTPRADLSDRLDGVQPRILLPGSGVLRFGLREIHHTRSQYGQQLGGGLRPRRITRDQALAR